jgi:hypothetical protein
MKLYTMIIRGHKFYFTGNLKDELITATEQFCRQLESKTNDSDPQKIFTLVLKYIKLVYGCSVTQLNIEHIFRINF